MPGKAKSSSTHTSDPQGKFSSIVAKSGGTTEASLSLLNELGLKNGEWCFQSKPILENIMELYERADLWYRVLACIQLHTLGYLPSSGGVAAHKGAAGKVVFALDDRRFGHCKKHGALLAVTHTAKGKRVAIGPNHIRNEVNEAAIRAFERQEGREATEKEKEAISATPKHTRNVIDYLEELGLCLRTDNDDVPLAELRETAEGRDKLKRLSGDNKIRVYLYLRPRPSKLRQGTLHSGPSEVISNELKPLYKLFIGLKLDLDPTAFSFDGDLQATIRAELDERAKLIAERDEALKAAILQKYPSAQPSAASNSNGKEGTGQLGLATVKAPTSQPADAADQHSNLGTEAPLMSRPRRSAVPASSPARPEPTPPASRPSPPPTSSHGGRESFSDAWIDQAFRDQVISAFVDGGKDTPNLKQLADTQRELPDDVEARLAFVQELRLKMRRIEHPGVLGQLVKNFNVKWPALLTRKQAEFERSQPAVVDPVADLAIDIEIAETMPNHCEREAIRLRLAQAEIETPEIYAEAIERVRSQSRRVS